MLELGANDGLRGLPPAGTTANLQAIIDSVKAHYPNARVVVAGMQTLPNMARTMAQRSATFFQNWHQPITRPSSPSCWIMSAGSHSSTRAMAFILPRRP